MKRQQGFTLIELIVVIVILGILAATALPKFVNLQGDARAAKVNGALGSMKSASALAHAAQLVAGSASNASINMEGQTVTMVYGYPTADAAGMGLAAGLTSDYASSVSGTTLTVQADSGHTGCAVTYTAATASAPPTFSAAATSSSCN